jgi:penicillin-binding protein 2
MFGSESDDSDQRRRFSRRATLLGLGQMAGLGVLSARLYQLQVRDEGQYALAADENRTNLQMLASLRGRILDRFGEVLASNQESYRALLIPSLARDTRAVLTTFSRIVPVGPDEIDKFVLTAKRQAPNLPLIIASDLTYEQVAEINLLAPQLPGVQTEIAGKRRYFHGHATGHVVGYVGNVPKVGLNDDPVLKLPGARVGRTGVELGLEDKLRGLSGSVKHEVDARGRIVRVLDQKEAVRGEDVIVTLDTGLQAIFMARLAKERRAAAVAMHVASGEVVAMASVPSFDQAEMTSGVNQSNWVRLTQASNNPMLNRASRGEYPPGSTFKMVTALAALEGGLIDLKERIDCSGATELAGQVFRCWKRTGHGACELHRALRESCDCYFYEIARRCGIDAIAAMGRRLGLGQIYNNGLALQKPGLMPTADWKMGRHGRSWLGGETLLAGIGQGFVLTTPMQLATMTARLASGRAVEPQLVRPDLPQPGGGVAPPRSFASLGIKPQFLDAVRRGMAAVVNEDGGTGSAARLDTGETVAGKTGTSQVSRLSAERQGELPWEQRDHALFVAYVPADKPRYALSVIVEHGGGGGATAGPIARDLLAAVLARDPMGKAALPDLPVPNGPPKSRG